LEERGTLHETIVPLPRSISRMVMLFYFLFFFMFSPCLLEPPYSYQ
jgi:hypothetical protein